MNKPPPPPRKPITIKLAQNYDLPPPAQDKATFALGPSRTPAPNVDLMEGSSHMFVSQHPEASGSSRTQYNEFDVDPQEDTSRLLYRQFEERRVPSRTQQVDDSEQSERVRDKKKKKEEKHRTDEEATMSDAIDSKKRHKQKKEKKEKKHKHDREETAEEREERRRLKKERKRQEKADRKRQRAPSSTSEAPVAKKQKQKEVSPRPCFKLLIHIGKPTVAPVTALQPVASSSSQVPTSSHAVPSWQPTAPPVPSSRPIPPPSRSAPQPVPVNHGIFAEAMKPRPALAKIPAQPKAPALSKPPYAPKVKKEKESHSSHRTHSRRTSEKSVIFYLIKLLIKLNFSGL